MPTAPTVSVVIPARNEAASIGRVVAAVRQAVPGADVTVVDDGSDDATAAEAGAAGARVLRQPYTMGNGAAVKAGARAARGDVLVFLDGDGQHDPADIPRLLQALDDGHDLAIGARTADSQASVLRLVGNWVYNRMASWIVGHRVDDLTSGFRAARARRFREFLYLLPNGFSYPTTSTMAFYRAGYGVKFVPVTMGRRDGKSHIRILRDGGRFVLIIFRIGTLYSPLKIFVPTSALFFLCGLGYYAYTFLMFGRFTNLGALLFGTAVIIFMIGLVSEQITQLLYSQQKGD